MSDSYQKQMLGAIGLYFDLCLNRKLKLRHLYPKRRQHRLPKYLGQQEVKRMIEAADNIKHRCILKLLYGAGLRVSEVPALTLADIDPANMPIHIRYTKYWESRAVVRQAAARAKVGGAVSLHFLRHSFARHLVEGGADTLYVQKLLKHRSVRSRKSMCPLSKSIGIESKAHSTTSCERAAWEAFTAPARACARTIPLPEL